MDLNLKQTNTATGAATGIVSSTDRFKTPGQRFMDSSHHGCDKAKTFIDYALDRFHGKPPQQEQIKKLVLKIESMGGFPEPVD